MAIDMTTVKQIMHNNKEVVKIEDGLGKVLWQKQAQPEWHTIYEDSSYWRSWFYWIQCTLALEKRTSRRLVYRY